MNIRVEEFGELISLRVEYRYMHTCFLRSVKEPMMEEKEKNSR